MFIEPVHHTIVANQTTIGLITQPRYRNKELIVPKVTIGFGVALIALGMVSYFGAGTGDDGKTSITALIPAFVGLPLAVLGVVALKESLLKHAMHGAAALGLLGFLAAGGRFAMSGFAKPWPGTMILLMALICLAFVILCIKSFIDTRKARQTP